MISQSTWARRSIRGTTLPSVSRSDPAEPSSATPSPNPVRYSRSRTAVVSLKASLPARSCARARTTLPASMETGDLADPTPASTFAGVSGSYVPSATDASGSDHSKFASLATQLTRASMPPKVTGSPVSITVPYRVPLTYP